MRLIKNITHICILTFFVFVPFIASRLLGIDWKVAVWLIPITLGVVGGTMITDMIFNIGKEAVING